VTEPGSLPTRRLGHSDIDVTTLTLGAMMFGQWGNTDVDECRQMVRRALDGGITTFDTADMYDDGASETILGQSLRDLKVDRDDLVIATKVGNPMAGDLARSGLSRRWIMQACDDSLRRLQVDHIDLYQMHRPDPATRIDETLGALDELVAAGKVRAIGTSTFSAAQLDEVHACAAGRTITRPTSEQPPYSILARGIETEVMPTCRRHGVGLLVWAPLNGGWLTGKYQVASTPDPLSRAARQPDHFDHRDDAIRATKYTLVNQLITVAEQAGMSLAELALAFVLDESNVASAIIGPRTLEQLDQLLSLGPLVLPIGVREAIDAIVAPGRNVNPADAG
jgi:aryl-alcohol dehydrogenase-like predicted oxidoreductase